MDQSPPYRNGTPGSVPDGLESIQYINNYPEVVRVAAAKGDLPYMPYPPPLEKKILGMRVTTFILTLLLVLTVIIAAVAGGVGGSLAVDGAYTRGLQDGALATWTVTSVTTQTQTIAGSSKPTDSSDSTDDSDSTDSSDSTSSSKSTSSSDPTSTSKPTPTSDRIPTPPTDGVVELDCPRINDSTRRVSAAGQTATFRVTCGVNYPFNDITRFPSYSFQDCLIACNAWNVEKMGDLTCNGVIFGADLGPVPAAGGNCWLKTKMGDPDVQENALLANEIAAAERI
ncbi:uncharacterized protein DNG_04421 [Cephalotrichum gorgonifer]|uniref:Apple domain-containing protein n=1 Tax=Cephalotrichum gorgonifer TaxID=2041049 RepID=A0AAE8MYI0_9PEZI|nr:uncharacterized protein DNG_04421 [Cephalotrichum gorgonifer]